MDLSNPYTLWNPSFIRVANDWEIESLNSFLTLLFSVNPHSGEVDGMVWTPSHHGFVVKSYYTLSIRWQQFFPLEKHLEGKAPPRIAFFLWATILGRILTVDNLRLWGFQLVNRCCLCNKDEETINHLLHEYAADIWHLVLNSFGVSRVMPGNILQFLHCWKFQGRGHPREVIWKVIPALLMWSVWKEKSTVLWG